MRYVYLFVFGESSDEESLSSGTVKRHQLHRVWKWALVLGSCCPAAWVWRSGPGSVLGSCSSLVCANPCACRWDGGFTCQRCGVRVCGLWASLLGRIRRGEGYGFLCPLWNDTCHALHPKIAVVSELAPLAE